MAIKESTLADQDGSTTRSGVLSENRILQDSTSEKIPDTQVKADKRALRRTFSTAFKLKILEEYDACGNTLAKGALLRREGLYHSVLSTWRRQRDAGRLTETDVNLSRSASKNRQLARENEQLKKKLAQAGAIIDLPKKVSDLLGTHILSPENNETS